MIQGAEFRCLCLILGTKWQQEKLTNAEVQEKAGYSDIFTLFSHSRLQWLGHMNRWQKNSQAAPLRGACQGEVWQESFSYLSNVPPPPLPPSLFRLLMFPPSLYQLIQAMFPPAYTSLFRLSMFPPSLYQLTQAINVSPQLIPAYSGYQCFSPAYTSLFRLSMFSPSLYQLIQAMFPPAYTSLFRLSMFPPSLFRLSMFPPSLYQLIQAINVYHL